MKTAVVYARYSCDRQNEQSIDGQLRVSKIMQIKMIYSLLKPILTKQCLEQMMIESLFKECLKIATNRLGALCLFTN